MGFHLTTDGERALPAISFATPKAHTPGSRLQKRGLRYYSPSLGRWLSRDPIGERGGLNLQLACRNAPSYVVDPLGTECQVQSFKLVVKHWLTRDFGFVSGTWQRQLRVEFTLILDPCSKKEDCVIDQQKAGYVEYQAECMFPGVYVTTKKTYPEWTDDVGDDWSSSDWWNGTEWAHPKKTASISRELGQWSTTGWFGSGSSRATWFDEPGFAVNGPKEFPLYAGGTGKSGWFKFKTRVLDATTRVEKRSLTWGYMIDYSSPAKGTQAFNLNP